VINFRDDSESTKSINCDVLPVKTDQACLFNKSAGYIIVGGLTGLGWEIVELIAKMGGGCIAIFARRQPTDQRLAEMREMSEKYNCCIISLRADVSDFESVKKAFETYHAEYHDYPVKGIFHGAAVVEDAIIVYMTEEKFEKVLQPKIKGTLNLHILSKDMKLDYFILHSSVTSVFGNTGQMNYGAGNSFMDTFAYYRRSNGLSGQTINWGALHLGILTASEHVERHLNAQGYHSLNPDKIMECLLHTLSNDFTQIVYGIFKWDTIIRQSPDMIHISSKLQPILLELNLMTIFTAEQGTKIIVDLKELQKLSKDKLYVKINEIVVLIAADLFALEVPMIQTTTPFTKLGIDSMTGMAFINTIYEHLSCKIPIMAVLSDEANIESISSLILQQMSVSSDVTGMVPVYKMLHLKSEIKSVSINLNFIEQSIYSFESHPNTFSFLRVDMTIMNSDIRESEIQNASQELVSLYPELTSIYAEMDGIPFRFVERSQLKEGVDKVDNSLFNHRTYVPNKEDVGGFRDMCIREIVDCKSQEEDDISTPKTVILEGRVFKIDCSREMDTLEVNLYFDRLLFDNISTEQLAVNFVSILDGTHVKNKQETDYDNTEQEELNRAIREHKEDGKRFWSSRVSMAAIPPVMFGESQFVDKNETDVEIRTVTLTKEVWTTLKDFNLNNQITNFEFFIGIYQLLLHLISENDIISVASFVDLRQFLQRSENTGTIENLIPFITTFQKNKTCIQYLLENVENVRDTQKHGIIPFNDMQNMFTNTLSGINAFMHGIFTDITCGTDFVDISANVKLKPIRSFDSRFQTSLHISDTEIPEHIVLSLHYKLRFVQENTASQVLRGLLEITETILSVKEVTIEQIKKKYNSAQKETIGKFPNSQKKQTYTNGDVDEENLLLHGGDSLVLNGGETVVLNRNVKDGIRFKGKIYSVFCCFCCFLLLFFCVFVLFCFVFAFYFIFGGRDHILHTSQAIQYNYRQDTILHNTSTIN
jgi:NAD(P)-dependent dehydrogenase (short-subunit alcohol dehydrogenase family)/acyl carrier protein